MPTLLGRLMARPAEDLADLARAWAARLPGRSHAEDVAALYRVMTDTWALRDMLEDLSPPAARWLWALARDAGAAEAGDDEATRQAAADELAARGLLHPSPDGPAGRAPPLVLAD